MENSQANLKIGKYRHSKSGKEYEVLFIATDSETQEKVVVYKALYGENLIWVRPLKMFLEEVEIGDVKIPRFVKIDN